MYILYVDDAGSPRNSEEKHFVLGGVALFEAHGYFLQNELERVVASTGLVQPETLELHGNEMQSGRGRWRPLRGRTERRAIITSALEQGFKLQGDWRIFGVVVEKAARPGVDPVEYAFEQLCARFDMFLSRKRHDGKPQKGLIVLDKSASETRLQGLTAEFRRSGHSWGQLRNFADVPFFADSRATRLIQYADLVTYALWRAFEKDDWEFYNLIHRKFDSEGGVVHGLLHERYANSSCPCAYCNSRRA
jgi:Protein of unknown function (DUF3800)